MMTFQNFGLQQEILDALSEKGYQTPTAVQEKSIPVLMQGEKDFIGLAQTGTGKTAAFGLPLLHLVNLNDRSPQALIICPTRELCLQITREITDFAAKLNHFQIVAVYGGASIGDQIKQIRRGVQVVVATPGRLIDLIERKAINLGAIKYVVLDEADEMLNMGFQEDIEFVLQQTPNRDSIWLFSATMPPPIRKVSKQYMEKPFEVTIGKVNTTNVNIDHQFCFTTAPHRYETLKRIIDFNPGMYGLIFTRTKADAQSITENLVREGYDVDALHGDLSQPQRDKVMSAFRSKALQVLVATDVAARGIDVTGITHVINYELPDDPEIYTHRSGRTGRAGATGICISIVTSRETRRQRDVEQVNQIRMHRFEIPSGKDVCRKQFYYFIDKLHDADISHGDYETYLPVLQERFADMSKEELVQRVAALEFDRFLKYYENAEDLNPRKEDRGIRKDIRGIKRPEGVSGSGDYVRLFVNLGTKDGFYKASFLQYILDKSDLSKAVLGKIDMKDLKSIIEIDKGAAKQMLQSLDGKLYKGRKIRMNPA